MRSKELEVLAPAPAAGPTYCSAYGCPMAGTYGRHTSTTPNPSWWCGFHTETNEKQTGEITQLVKKNFKFIRAAYAIMLVPVSKQQEEILASFGRAMVKAGRPDFAPKEKETPFVVGYRIIRQLQNEISGDKRQSEKTESGENKETVELAEILRSLNLT